MKVIMWIARDEDGSLFMYQNKPRKEKFHWYSADYDLYPIEDTLFPEIEWEDPKPTKVQIEIKK